MNEKKAFVRARDRTKVEAREVLRIWEDGDMYCWVVRHGGFPIHIDRKLYPDWKGISAALRKAAGNNYEASGLHESQAGTIN